MHRLFVYGSLRRGGGAHDKLRGARLLGQVRTRQAYELVDLGSYPGMIHGARSVMGEVYQVSSRVLSRLDRYEEVPRLYIRKPVILCGFGGVQSYLLRYKPSATELLRHGDWLLA